MIAFGVLGYIFQKIDWPLTPTVLALILGPMMEKALRTSLENVRRGSEYPGDSAISGGLLIIAALVLLAPAVRLVRTRMTPEGG